MPALQLRNNNSELRKYNQDTAVGVIKVASHSTPTGYYIHHISSEPQQDIIGVSGRDFSRTSNDDVLRLPTIAG
jgi:hypothetical protein